MKEIFRKSILYFIIISILTIGCDKMTEYVEVKDTGDLQEFEGKKVAIEGSISDMPWQHLINFPETHPVITYLDIGGDQIVIYTQDSLNCTGKVKVNGTVVKVQGTSKRPGSDETYVEYHIIVDSWESVKD